MSARTELSRMIGGRVQAIQDAYLLRRTSEASATLAALRHALGKEPGSVPSIWQITIEGVSDSSWDAPSWSERAAHDALTLYALHQQSRVDPMHVHERRLGTAVCMLGQGGTTDREQAVRRRFDAAATSATYSELTYHLRGLVSQLRSAGIGIDYGILADDLLRSQIPDGMRLVRLWWARSYYRGERPMQIDEPRFELAQTDRQQEEEA